MLKIASFNLFNYIEPPLACYDFDRIYDQQQWQKKQCWIRDYLSLHQPDVIGLQEVFSPQSLQQLLAECGYPYFAVVDQAELISDYIYRSPVVAIASRYPISAIEAVSADNALAVAMGLSASFQFSRKPLRASIELPHLGTTDCYVVHLKSKRGLFDREDLDASEPAKVVDAFSKQICGDWGSSIQRGSEAALLAHGILERRLATSYPVVLMGDFNDVLSATKGNGILNHLTMNTLAFNNDPQIQAIVSAHALRDSWQLYQAASHGQPSAQPPLRPPTHYYQGQGSVLDYILLSSEFDAQYPRSSVEVSDYHCYDHHLINPIFDRDSESTDHAIVQINLKLRS